ncbi:hypothetical protein ABPG72_020011 [Tetrahymena utriculariae]
MNKPLTEFNRGFIIGLKVANFSYKAIQTHIKERKLEGSFATIKRVWKQWNEQNKTKVEFKGNSGRKSKMTQESVNKLESYIIQNPQASRKQLESDQNANPQGVSDINFRNQSREACEVAKELLRGSKRLLKSCIYTDETWICFENSYKSKTWVHKEKQPQENVRSKQRWPPKVQVWGAINQDGAMALKLFEGNMNADNYYSILKYFFENDVEGFDFDCFQQDNASSHTTKEITEYFEAKKVKLLPWASQSPDINPIEVVWAHLKKIITKQMQNFEDFNKFVEFVQITFLSSKELRKTIQNCIKSIPQNLNKVIEAKGYAIK